jgi:hypothetical protein
LSTEAGEFREAFPGSVSSVSPTSIKRWDEKKLKFQNVDLVERRDKNILTKENAFVINCTILTWGRGFYGFQIDGRTRSDA